MRNVKAFHSQGVASQLLEHLIDYAQAKGAKSLSLETGSQDYFSAARELYEKYGFDYCGPFADYKSDPNSRFMTLNL
jgi:putative acetyltransferase